jgi:hypothetical protein
MSDLRHINRVVATEVRTADLLADIPDVLQKWERVLRGYAGVSKYLPMVSGYHPTNSGLDEMDHKILRGLPTMLRRFPSISYATLHSQVGVGRLFLALLQQYEMSPALRRKVEVAAKFWSKTKALDPKRGTEEATFHKLTQVYLEQFNLAKDVVSKGVERSTMAPEMVKNWTAGPFRLVNTGGFDDKTMENCAQVVEKAVQLLKSKGLGKVCYGDMLVSNTIGRNSRVLAFYLPDKDEMFIRANLKGVVQDAVHTVIHELGHRLHRKFLGNKDREINSLYHTLASRSHGDQRAKIDTIRKDPNLLPKPGDKISTGRGKNYEVAAVAYDKVHLRSLDTPGVTAKVDLLGYMEIKGLKVETPTNGFVTEYAGKSAAENFAEMVTFYCLGRLNPEHTQMLETIL